MEVAKIQKQYNRLEKGPRYDSWIGRGTFLCGVLFLCMCGNPLGALVFFLEKSKRPK